MAVGLKESKKYAIGSKHENGGGKFEILERWYDEATETIMLKYKFEDGKEETNKEANVNASEWKWRKVRGKTGSAETEATHEGLHQEKDILWEEYFEGAIVRFEKLSMEHATSIKHFDIENAKQQAILKELVALIQVQSVQIENLANDRTIMNKLLEKL